MMRPVREGNQCYSETRVAVLRKHHAKWLFPQEKATSQTLCKGTFTLISLWPAFLTAKSMRCSADLLVGCTGGVLAARARLRSSIPLAHAVTEQTVSGVGREAHATAGQEAGATDSLTCFVRNAG
jgi:hypothetical protein